MTLVGGGEVCSGVGEVALIVPPCEASGVRVPLAFEGESARLVKVGIESVEERLERAVVGLCGYEGTTDDGVVDPKSVCLCSRG